MWTVQQIIAGGQTGADRAALDWALAHGIPHGGWCPAGRHAEDGRIAARYHLQETPSADDEQRTEWNVRAADGTVVISVASRLSGGSLRIIEHAAQYDTPSLYLHQGQGNGDAGARLLAFLTEHRIRVLNVAGPRASMEPGVGRFVVEALGDAWQQAQHQRLGAR